MVERAASRNLPRADFWAERGEHGRWVKVEFYPEEAPSGPGRKTRLKPLRKVQGAYLSGLGFKRENDWTMDNTDDKLNEN